MLRVIQANDLALTLNVLAVCAVFVFVGAVLLVLSSRDRRQRQINNAEYVSVLDMKIEIEISGVLQFRLVLHTSGTVPSTATSS